MRTLLISVLAVGALITVSPARAQEMTKEAKIEQILTLTKIESMMDRTLAQMKAMSAQATAGMTPDEQAKAQATQDKILDLAKAAWTKLRPQYVKLYSETFSDEEIDGLLAFYQSSTGQAMIEKMPELMAKFMTLMMPEMQRIMKEAQQK